SCAAAATAPVAIARRTGPAGPTRRHARGSKQSAAAGTNSPRLGPLGEQRHLGKAGGVDEPQRVHEPRVTDPAVAAYIDDTLGVFGCELRQPVLEIGGGDRLVADEGVAVA